MSILHHPFPQVTWFTSHDFPPLNEGSLSLTLSQVSPQAILATIGVIFPRNKDKDAYFDTRKEPDLSKEICRRVCWVEPSGIYSQAHYKVYYSDRWSAIEFLNNTWYWIYPSDNHWSAAKSDRVTDLRLVGLGTPLYPYCYVLKARNFIFHLLTNTFSSHDLFPTPFPSHDFITWPLTYRSYHVIPLWLCMWLILTPTQ